MTPELNPSFKERFAQWVPERFRNKLLEPKRPQSPSLPYIRHLESFDRVVGLSKMSHRPEDISTILEYFLTARNELQLERRYGVDIAFCSALLRFEGDFRGFIVRLLANSNVPSLAENLRTTETVVDRISEWAVGEFAEKRGLRYRFRKVPIRTKDEYKMLLTQIEQEWPRST